MTAGRLAMAVGGGGCLTAVIILQFLGLEWQLRVGLSVGGGLLGIGLICGSQRTPTGMGYSLAKRSMDLCAQHDSHLPAGNTPLMVRKHYPNGWPGQEAHITMAGLAVLCARERRIQVCTTLDAATRALQAFARQRDEPQRVLLVPTYTRDEANDGIDEHKVALLLDRNDRDQLQIRVIDSCSALTDDRAQRVFEAIRNAKLHNPIISWSTHRVQRSQTGCEQFARHHAYRWLEYGMADAQIDARAGTLNDPHLIRRLPSAWRDAEQTRDATGIFHLELVMADGQPVYRNKLIDRQLMQAQRQLVDQLLVDAAAVQVTVGDRLVA
jgi:hypothetical protein